MNTESLDQLLSNLPHDILAKYEHPAQDLLSLLPQDMQRNYASIHTNLVNEGNKTVQDYQAQKKRDEEELKNKLLQLDVQYDMKINQHQEQFRQQKRQIDLNFEITIRQWIQSILDKHGPVSTYVSQAKEYPYLLWLGAHQGDPECCFLYAEECYKQNSESYSEKIIAFYKQAAEKGHARAQWVMGEIMIDNNKLEEALQWYEKSAAQNESQGHNSLAYHLNGEKCFYHASQAVKYDCKNATAWFNLGYCYENGEGCEKNIELAIQAYTKAALLGDQGAKKRITDLLDIDMKEE